jgi:hypothetical protein
MRILSRKATQNLSEGAMNANFTFDEAVKLVTVYVHASAPITEEVSIYFVSEEGVNFNTLIAKEDISDMSDYVFAANGALAIGETESFKVEITNANAIGIVYVTVKAEK